MYKLQFKDPPSDEWSADNPQKFKVAVIVPMFGEAWKTWCAQYANVKINHVKCYVSCNLVSNTVYDWYFYGEQHTTDPRYANTASGIFNVPNSIPFRLGWNADRYMDDTLNKEKIYEDRNAFKNIYMNRRKAVCFRYTPPNLYRQYVRCDVAKDCASTSTLKDNLDKLYEVSDLRCPSVWYGSYLLDPSIISPAITEHEWKDHAMVVTPTYPGLNLLLVMKWYISCTFRGSNTY